MPSCITTMKHRVMLQTTHKQGPIMVVSFEQRQDLLTGKSRKQSLRSIKISALTTLQVSLAGQILDSFQHNEYSQLVHRDQFPPQLCLLVISACASSCIARHLSLCTILPILTHTPALHSCYAYVHHTLVMRAYGKRLQHHPNKYTWQEAQKERQIPVI